MRTMWHFTTRMGWSMLMVLVTIREMKCPGGRWRVSDTLEDGSRLVKVTSFSVSDKEQVQETLIHLLIRAFVS